MIDELQPSRYAEAIKEWLTRARQRTDGIEGDALAAKVETYLEELQVAEEELRVQNDELQSALAEADAQRQRYRDLFDDAPLPYLTTDSKGRIQEINHAAAGLLGVPVERVKGKPLPVFLGGGGELRTRILQLASGSDLEPWESEIKRRDGGTIAVEVSASVVNGSRAGDAEIRWVIQDTRARLQAREQERELHREQAARAALVQVARRAGFLADASARLMGVLEPPDVWTLGAEIAGEHARAALLLEAEGDRGACVRGVGGSPEGRRDLEPLLGRVLDWQAGTVDGVLVPMRAVRTSIERGDPEVIPAPDDTPDAAGACLAVPIRSPERTLGAMVVWLAPEARIGEELLVARNLADRIALSLESAVMFQEVVRARREAESATTAEADFLAIVSHELRTPLTAIVSYAELLEDRASEMPEKLARYAHQIAAAADHQRKLVEQILAYKGVQLEGSDVAPEELDFRKVARSAVAMVRPQVGDRPIDLAYSVPNVPVQGVSDRGKLQQILTNLLSNALRHTSRGSVRLTLETLHQWVVFRVEDEGEGIDPEALPRIFDRFWRGATRGEERGGSGLGLTITRELVDRLSGEIDVESEPGVGTTFTVRIPRVQP